jgi:plastocyanin
MRLLHALPLLVALSPALAGAEGGTVKGVVTAAGQYGGPVADAVVVLEGPSVAAPAGAPHVVVDQRDDTFVPHVVAVPVGTTVDFPNRDPHLHNVFSASPAKKFDLGMYGTGETRSVTFDAPGVVRVGCSVHPKMEAFVVVHANPWAAVTDARGAYAIANVAPGSYTVRVWHARGGEARSTVTVAAGQVVALDLRLSESR